MQSFFSRGRGIFLLVTLLISIGAGYSLMNDQPANEEQTVTPTLDLIEPYHFSFWESYALCEEYNLGCKPVSLAMEMPAEFLQMNIENLRELYPQPAWLVLEDGKEVSITHLLDGLCAEHKKIMHLGVNQSGEYLTICYGPAKVSSLGGVYLVSDIPLLSLTAEEQDKVLHGAYESSSYEELQGILDSFSESY